MEPTSLCSCGETIRELEAALAEAQRALEDVQIVPADEQLALPRRRGVHPRRRGDSVSRVRWLWGRAMTEPTAADMEVAQMIVNGIIDTIERAGRFDGRGKSRALVFSCGVNLATGETFDVMDRMVEWTAEQLVAKPAERSGARP